MLDLIERSRASLPGHAAVQDLFDEAETALGADVMVVRLDQGDLLPVGGLIGADLVVGDVAVDKLTLGSAERNAVGPLVVLSPADYEPSELDRIASMISDDRRLAVQASRGLAALRIALDQVDASDRAAVGELVDQTDELEQMLPGLLELAALRQSTVGRGSLPGALGAEFRRLLLEIEPARRLGLDPDVESAELAPATAETLDRWRTMLNGGRIPFSARPLVNQLIRSLERLWSNVAES